MREIEDDIIITIVPTRPVSFTVEEQILAHNEDTRGRGKRHEIISNFG